jgi:hypothetical protein
MARGVWTTELSFAIATTYNLKLKTSAEKAKGIWLGADHFSAQYRTKPLDPTTHSAANA